MKEKKYSIKKSKDSNETSSHKKPNFRMKSNNFWLEFKAFISRGNILDLAIGIVIGTAFTKIITEFVNSIIMPLLSLVIGRIDISALKWVIIQADIENNITELAVGYGNFIQLIINFVIIAFSIFVALKLIKRIGKGTEKILEESKNKISQIIGKPEENNEVIVSVEVDQPSNDSKDTSATPPSIAKSIIVDDLNSLRFEGASNRAVQDLLTEIRDLLKKEHIK